MKNIEKSKKAYQEFLFKINAEFERRGFVFFQEIEDLEHVKCDYLKDAVFFGIQDRQAKTSSQYILINKLDLNWGVRYPEQYLMIRKSFFKVLIGLGYSKEQILSWVINYTTEKNKSS